jgi:hypothetical protein
MTSVASLDLDEQPAEGQGAGNYGADDVGVDQPEDRPVERDRQKKANTWPEDQGEDQHDPTRHSLHDRVYRPVVQAIRLAHSVEGEGSVLELTTNSAIGYDGIDPSHAEITW